jgi:hypothetical protein
MCDHSDSLELENLCWQGCTFWYDGEQFEVYETINSLYHFIIQKVGSVWIAGAYRYGSNSPEGIINWLSDFRGRSLLELLSLVVVVYQMKTDASVFTDFTCPASQELIRKASELRLNPPDWTIKFAHYEPNISSLPEE